MKKKNEHKIKYKLTPDTPTKKDTTWYPGHMAKALKQVQERIKKVDLILEIRDARLPLLSANKELGSLIHNKKKIILLNKADLADQAILKKWEQWFEFQNTQTISLNSLTKNAATKIISAIKELSQKEKTRVMIIGIPNCGKSTLINMLSGKRAAKTANKPGQTTAQQWINIAENIELLDTPGIMQPKIQDELHAKYLAAIHAIPDKILGKDEVAIFLLSYIIKHNSKAINDLYQVEVIDTIEALDLIGKARGALNKGNIVDYDRVYQMIINDFRSGKLGTYCFNSPSESV